MISDTVFLTFILMLTIFLGFELINKVPATLHTPLMSGANAISGITLVDALSLGGFVSLGLRVSQAHGFPWWVCLSNGGINATFGGVLRDIAHVEVPLIFRREIYATACLAGGVVLLGLDAAGVPARIGVLVITVLITVIRLLAIRYALNQSSD